jgi:phage terminase small subunit
MSKPLNIRQQRFCEFVASGLSGTEAWLKAGYAVGREVARRNASESLTKPVIKARIAQLRLPQTKRLLLTKDRHRQLLMAVEESGSEKTQDRLRAIEIDAKLAGFFAPDRVEVETGPKTLDDIKARADGMVSALDLRAHLRAQAQEPDNSCNGNGRKPDEKATPSPLSRWNPA